MLDPHKDRPTRDLASTRQLLEETQGMPGIGEAQKHVEHLSLHPYLTGFMRLKLTHCYLYVRYDSLHVLDGGMTSRIIVLVGNWLYYCSEGFEPSDKKGNEKWVRILHALHTAAARHGQQQEVGPACEARLQLAVHRIRAAPAADGVSFDGMTHEHWRANLFKLCLHRHFVQADACQITG